MYLATCILTGQDFEQIPDPDTYRGVQPNVKGIKKISSIRNTNPLAYAYMIKSIQMLREIGMFVDSVY